METRHMSTFEHLVAKAITTINSNAILQDARKNALERLLGLDCVYPITDVVRPIWTLARMIIRTKLTKNKNINCTNQMEIK